MDVTGIATSFMSTTELIYDSRAEGRLVTGVSLNFYKYFGRFFHFAVMCSCQARGRHCFLTGQVIVLFLTVRVDKDYIVPAWSHPLSRHVGRIMERCKRIESALLVHNEIFC